MTRVIAFDVNETLLDLGALDDAFVELFGSAASGSPSCSSSPSWGGLTGDYVPGASGSTSARSGWSLARSGDVSGALAAGCKAAFVARPGMAPSPFGPQPDVVGADVAEVVDQILARDVDPGGAP
ncbi:hypothetical protein [Pseudonocardia sp. GCM10023141]|uniref:hypothetical protein n=1 Tax=Pseudonocardia sp. GCM10023141 TaxID=3252653 RepID=UPI00360A165C